MVRPLMCMSLEELSGPIAQALASLPHPTTERCVALEVALPTDRKVVCVMATSSFSNIH